MNFLYRPIAREDFDALCALSKEAGVGVTSLRLSEEKLRARLELSIASLEKSVTMPGAEKYLFVLEDLESGQVIGTSGITACIGEEIPYYSYRISTITRFSKELNIRHYYNHLTLVNDYHGASEIGSLLLSSRVRKKGVGKFLSRARFMFIASFPERFSQLVIAEMRGCCDQNGISPFWESLGRHFFKMDFDQADRLCELTNKQFIADLMPRNPIYTELLSPAAQAVIGRPHPETMPAYEILMKEGFAYRGYIDIFDGGPAIEVQTQHIHTCRLSQVLTIDRIESVSDHAVCLVSSINTDFRVMMIPLRVSEQGCVISPLAAEHLGVGVGDSVRVCPV